MTIRIASACLVLACLAAAESNADSPAEESDPKPFYELREHGAGYAGPGREDPPPGHVKEVLLGYFGPNDPADPEGGDLWLAAELAVEQANREGGYEGKPFRIVPGWSENPWGTGVSRVARMAYADRVWAIVGGIDGPSTHLAEQVVAKARLPLVSPASGDKSVNLANVPWMFSLLPGDHLQAPLLAAAIAGRIGSGGALVLVSADDHDSRLFAGEVRKRLADRRVAIGYDFVSPAAQADVRPTVARVLQTSPGAVAIVAGSAHSARLVADLRGRGFSGPIFGGPAMGRRRFVREAGEAAEGVLFPLLYDPASAEGQRGQFVRAFEARRGDPPDYAAAHAYDAMRLVIAAVRKAGLNRARIRDALAELSPYEGVTGTVTWDRLGANTRGVRLGTIRQGRVAAADDEDPHPGHLSRQAGGGSHGRRADLR